MKNIQTMFLKFISLLLFVFLVSFTSYGQNHTIKLKKADSLFSAKFYTQSFELYNELFTSKMYTPAMLLKMAFIQEGLGHLSLSLYYLNLYNTIIHDAETVEKINELATKNSLEGYGDPYSKEKMFNFLQENRMQLSAGLVIISILLTSVMLIQKNRKKQPIGIAILLTLVLGVLFLQINFNEPKSSAIISLPNTYLMDGPSAGASVLSIVGEGHKVAIEGNYDVWRKVKWNGKDAFIKENGLLPINLN